MFKNKKDTLLICLMFVLLTILGIGYKFFYKKDKSVNDSKVNDVVVKDKLIEYENKSLNSNIFVHIDGAIKNPDVYEMKEGDRVKDLLEKAGGLLDDADTSRLNLAVKLKDEMKIHIYKVGETSDENPTSSQDNTNTSEIVNINTASVDELCKLTGIGETKAKLIVEYRNNKKFETIEEITNVSGIGKKTFEKIKDKITVK
ncbi:MAG: helix-hairpin-helix domain-containing protein [Peptoniphilaceae bacterium]|uniref:helix-hairpin-helix domain-containing protein n=1 Tax=Parvimonas sp. TaxID=1944660 RepID=UPI0025D1D35F|nr:helix-hairpin-helix domain-containing protein [Parvimonas sp.]MCI5997493.1 helix-hairpin-helix domain-containing protein [Parvimonas sp.]MDD7764602.1 helix-hairpin-helix domain-containing protein [Peptoniphilaceae bacterium]MDY3050578.1 helix-hairpin-helix domain-containing protein [Parvimonas sp.]